jgi:hypothetical protein
MNLEMTKRLIIFGTGVVERIIYYENVFHDEFSIQVIYYRIYITFNRHCEKKNTFNKNKQRVIVTKIFNPRVYI